MQTWNRRQWLAAAGGLSAAAQLGCQRKDPPVKKGVAIDEYEPKSMLHVPETKVPRSRFPVIDVHTHLTFSPGLGKQGGLIEPAPPEEILAVMDRKNIRMMVDLTGGNGAVLDQAISRWQKPHPDRFACFTEPMYGKAADPSYAKLQGDEVEKARRAGAKGMKVVKTLGLVLRENITSGRLIKVDDPRFDPMWEACGALKMPVAIHTSDPEAFFLPIDRFNERYEELNAHPDWSFHGQDFPSNRELQEARNRVIARHPKTSSSVFTSPIRRTWRWCRSGWTATRTCTSKSARASANSAASRAHRASSSTTTRTGSCSAPTPFPRRRLSAAGVRRRAVRDLLPVSGNRRRVLRLRPGPQPPQGRWRISGLGLPEPILKQVYYRNAERLLGLA